MLDLLIQARAAVPLNLPPGIDPDTPSPAFMRLYCHQDTLQATVASLQSRLQADPGICEIAVTIPDAVVCSWYTDEWMHPDGWDAQDLFEDAPMTVNEVENQYFYSLDAVHNPGGLTELAVRRGVMWFRTEGARTCDISACRLNSVTQQPWAGLTDDVFTQIVEDLAREQGTAAVLAVPGVLCLVMEEWNNEVLERFAVHNNLDETTGLPGVS